MYALVVLVLLGDAGPAEKPAVRHLRAATELYDKLDYERALQQLQQARKFSGGVEDDVPIAILEGVVLCDAGRMEEGVAAFREALSLDPEAKVNLKVSPKLLALFEEQRAAIRKGLDRHKPPAATAGLEAAASPTPSRAPTFVALAAALAFGATAGVLAGLAKSREDALRSGAPNTASDGMQLVNEGQAFQVTAFVFAGAAVVAAAVGVVTLLVGRSPANVAFFSPSHGRGLFGVRGAF